MNEPRSEWHRVSEHMIEKGRYWITRWEWDDGRKTYALWCAGEALARAVSDDVDELMEMV